VVRSDIAARVSVRSSEAVRALVLRAGRDGKPDKRAVIAICGPGEYGGDVGEPAAVVLVGRGVCSAECIAAGGVGGDGVGAGAGAGGDDPAAVVADWCAGAGDGASGVGAEGRELSAAGFALASSETSSLLRGGGPRQD
jgi:hypothetical protein